MNGSEQFQIKLSKNFERTQQKLIRDRYRKNQAGLVKFMDNYEVSDESNNLADSGDGETVEDKLGENKSNDS
ncbi:hypothetical protein [Microcoleus sp.]|uniref:hypothetical protein n=1 Tax=Microcoleus sp. TaxID=44472 RepID=UPI003523FE42